MIDWDEIEEAVREYGIEMEARAEGWRRNDSFGFEATMVRIHNEIRRAQEDDE